jgi:hypothetical protein
VSGCRGVELPSWRPTDAAEEWIESIHHDLGHPMYEDENCPHCQAKVRLEKAVARLIDGWGGPSDLGPH